MANENKSTQEEKIENEESSEKSGFDPLRYVDGRIPPSLDFTLRGVFLR